MIFRRFLENESRHHSKAGWRRGLIKRSVKRLRNSRFTRRCLLLRIRVSVPTHTTGPTHPRSHRSSIHRSCAMSLKPSREREAFIKQAITALAAQSTQTTDEQYASIAFKKLHYDFPVLLSWCIYGLFTMQGSPAVRLSTCNYHLHHAGCDCEGDPCVGLSLPVRQARISHTAVQHSMRG